jgi:hypothetical protein
MGGKRTFGEQKRIAGELVNVGMLECAIRMMISQAHGGVWHSLSAIQMGLLEVARDPRPRFCLQEIPALSRALERPTRRFGWAGVKNALGSASDGGLGVDGGGRLSWGSRSIHLEDADE